eukprot:FR737504.1.p1 GENE.FR737504.1~~FR737504.1.p1  ORF type:complete len:172 (+),score=18.59 FR737504.1:149-664(+)
MTLGSHTRGPPVTPIRGKHHVEPHKAQLMSRSYQRPSSPDVQRGFKAWGGPNFLEGERVWLMILHKGRDSGTFHLGLVCAHHPDGTHDVKQEEYGQLHQHIHPDGLKVKMIPAGRASLFAGQWKEEQPTVTADEMFGHGLSELFKRQTHTGGTQNGQVTPITTQVYPRLSY